MTNRGADDLSEGARSPSRAVLDPRDIARRCRDLRRPRTSHVVPGSDVRSRLAGLAPRGRRICCRVALAMARIAGRLHRVVRRQRTLACPIGRARAAKLARRRSDRRRRSTRGSRGRHPRPSLRRPDSATRYTASGAAHPCPRRPPCHHHRPHRRGDGPAHDGTAQRRPGGDRLADLVGRRRDRGHRVRAPGAHAPTLTGHVLVGTPMEDRRPVTSDLRDRDGCDRPEFRPGADPNG